MEAGLSDERWMREALVLASQAAAQGEVPIGAVVVYENRIIGRGYNVTRRLQDATAHAEIMALREAADWLGNWYFQDCTLYVTVEPCVMCAGAVILGRLGRLVYGTTEPKFGACGSLYNLVEDSRFNHRVAVNRGVLEKECAEMMREFFRSLRE